MTWRRPGWWGLLSGLLLVALAAWQFDFLGAGLWDPIPHGRNEDWDWQLTLYEVSRLAVLHFRELPAWNPYTQGGVPLWANPEAPFLYPGFALVLALGTEAGLKTWILLHQALLVLGGWLAGRRMGLSPLAAHGAALAALCSAHLPGFIAVGHVMYLPLGWLPLAWVAQRAGRWRLAGTCLALAFLAGGHHLLLYGALWLGLDALGRGLAPRRLRWLVLGLALNGLLLGLHALGTVLAVLLAALLLLQRPAGLVARLRPMLLAGVVTGLLCGVRLATTPVLSARAERLEAQVSTRIADDYDLPRALAVLAGRTPRPSDHEGQNVFWSPVPVAGGIAGLLGLAVARPELGLAAWTFWNLGWGGATPANLLQVLHRLPGFDHLRVVERYGLVWTLFLGWGLGWLADRLVAWRPWPGALAVLVALGAWLRVAAPEAAQAQRLGAAPRPPPAEDPGPLRQTRGPATNYQAVRSGLGKLDCWTTAWLADPSPMLRAVGDPDYRGEAWRVDDGTAVPVSFTSRRVRLHLDRAGRVAINQNAFAGWRVDGRPADGWNGLLSAELSAGDHTFRYDPPGLVAGMALTLLGLLLAAGAPWRAGARPSSGTSPPPGRGPRRPGGPV